jgi:hypothetical protein
MRNPKLTILALSLAGAFTARAADPAAEPKKEPAAKPAPSLSPKAAHGGMTTEEEAEFNRIRIKTEALEDSRDASGFKGLKISGYADVNYVYNVNKERGTFQFLVPIDKEPYAYDNSYFGTVALDIQKETDSGTRFRLTLVPKRSTGDVMGEYSIVHEATVSIPVSGKVRVFAGQIPDWQGYEYLPATQNKLITHNLLFDFTLPAAYTGAGLEFPLDKLAMKAAVVNINTSVRNLGEHVPVLVFRGDYGVSEFFGWGFAGLVGNKANFRADDGVGNPVTALPYDTKDTLAGTFEADLWYTRGALSLFGQASWGMQQKAAITADPTTGDLRDAQWYGASAEAAYKFSPRFEGVLRGDYVYNQKNGGGLLDWTFADPVNGLGPDPVGDQEKGADRYAATVGFNYAVNANTTFKAEYRYDGATRSVFGNKAALADPASADAKYSKNNSLVSTGVVVFF